MSAYDDLLEATIRHLEDLKARGARLVAVAPETLRALAQPAGGSPVPNFNSRAENAAAPAPAAGSAAVSAAGGLTPAIAQPPAAQPVLLPLP
ncbi:MAG: hypothetical protein KGJ88_14010, partial [Verrucomicrobiota bacterium]|nr:hypothetical protein [Verrucomicrobiota bacterium]